jgi:hypothetical protein
MNSESECAIDVGELVCTEILTATVTTECIAEPSQVIGRFG